MHETPDLLPDRPERPDSSIDVVSDILDAVHLTTAVFGRMELGSPWHLRIPARECLSFYVVARGSAWIEMQESGSGGRDVRADGRSAVALSAGDAALLPRGSGPTLRDAERSDAPAHDFNYGECPRVWIGEPARFGGRGPVASLVAGHFGFGGTASRNPLLGSLPALVHLPASNLGLPGGHAASRSTRLAAEQRKTGVDGAGHAYVGVIPPDDESSVRGPMVCLPLYRPRRLSRRPGACARHAEAPPMPIEDVHFDSGKAPCGRLVEGERHLDRDAECLLTDDYRYACGCRRTRHEYHDGSFSRVVRHHDGRVLVDELLSAE